MITGKNSDRVPKNGPTTGRLVPSQSGSADPRSDDAKLNNSEVAVYALYLTGGASRHVHTEEVALKCFELAPDAFSWVRFPKYPDKDIARVALTDARKDSNGNLVMGRAGKGVRKARAPQSPAVSDGWMLTDAGAAWVTRHEQELASLFASRAPRVDRQDLLQRLSRVRTHILFITFKESPTAFSPSLGELADLFKCRPDAPFSIWQKRIQGLRSQARIAGQADTIQFLDHCLKILDRSGSSASSK
jgi:hypothetical protein